ncbi:hypothetical protein LX87_01131 [Larkinella arboricola]|uniref:Uncharacterized protein n=1 Tax=Larkinella arboricola TaxID=643671 RepID=A0A327X8J4_LARAB|nr:hypothetical protein [Larkinella arboricola]RAK03009.1 hypothetical protein LX87_01131 [Larkinella arboricola]
MNQPSFRANGLFFLVLLLLVQGCSRKEKKAEKQPETKPAGISNILFFLETSASMGGYLKGETNFKVTVSELVTKLNQVAPVEVWTIAGKPQPFAGGYNQFVVNLATTPLANERSSELHRIFKQVGEKAKGNTVAMLVSDCILSFPDAEIKKNPEINRQNAESVLKSQINDQFAALKKQGISATVFAYSSGFNGTYYDYQNNKHKLTGESRPFYVWVIGKQELVADLNQKLNELLITKPAKQLDFGASGALKQYDLFFSLNKKGDWRAEKAGLSELTVKPSKPAEFAVGVNLGGLPTYAQAEDYVKKNLAVTSPNATVKLVNVQKKEKVPTERIKERELKLLNQNTHVLTFRVENLYDEKANVAIKLPVRFDDWYATGWSTMDDRTPASRLNKTFALVHLMNGVKEAYQSSTNDFLVLNLTLEK